MIMLTSCLFRMRPSHFSTPSLCYNAMLVEVGAPLGKMLVYCVTTCNYSYVILKVFMRDPQPLQAKITYEILQSLKARAKFSNNISKEMYKNL